MTRWLTMLLIPLGLWSCSGKTAAGGSCSNNSACAAGQVCIDGRCQTVCRTDTDCGPNDCSGNGQICANQICVAGCRDTVPQIVAIDGTGADDSGTDPRGAKAAHRLRDLLVVTGAHLQGATATLTPALGGSITLAVATSSDTELRATLPADLAAGEYTLIIANAVGADQAGVWVLQGEQGERGPPGEPQTGAGVLTLLQGLGNPVPGLHAESAASATRAAALLDASNTPRTYAEIAMPAGAVTYFASATCPAGWIEANGAVVSRATYAGLFAALGTAYGAGDGSTTFGLPDYRGEFLRSWDAGRGLDSGRAVGSVQTADQRTFIAQNSGPYASPSYTHSMSSYVPKDGNWSGDNLFGGYWSTPCGGIKFAWDNSSEIRPRNVALLVCLKL